MKKIIDKIYNNKILTINELNKFELKIKNLNIPSDFYTISKSKAGIFIAVTNIVIFDKYFKNIISIPENKNKRIASAISGNSHKSNCSSSLLNYKLLSLLKEELRSYEILPSNNKPKKKKAIIIENLETFIDNDFIIKNFKDIDNYEIILGNGNYITSANFAEYLNYFSEIHCLFDWDLYGLGFFLNIKSKNSNTFWYAPNSFYEIAAKYSVSKNKISNNEINELKKLMINTDDSFLKTVIFLCQKKIFVEQEIFQNREV